jgi:tripartite-type tricarboxylate transporter receptor subunit TctC
MIDIYTIAGNMHESVLICINIIDELAGLSMVAALQNGFVLKSASCSCGGAWMSVLKAEATVARAAAAAMRRLAAGVLVGATLAICAPCVPASAQDWPKKPVRIVSPFAAGGSSDAMGRIVAENLSQRMHQQFYVENRGGAGGLIGSAAVANAPPDGYTFLISSIATHVIAPATSANPGYDPIGSFTHVASVGGPPTVIAVNPALGVRSLTELRALLKSRSDALPYVSPGPGTIGNLIAELWAEKEGIKLSHVAYKGAGQAITDLVAGHVQMGSMTWTAALGQMQAKTIIPLAVSSLRRMPEFPDVPTLKELGYPDLAVTTWFAFAAPAGLPGTIALRMNEEVGNALDAPAVRDRLVAEGFELEKMSPAELTAFIREGLDRWGPLAKRLMSAGADK